VFYGGTLSAPVAYKCFWYRKQPRTSTNLETVWSIWSFTEWYAPEIDSD
jgi:hypothetical protein